MDGSRSSLWLCGLHFQFSRRHMVGFWCHCPKGRHRRRPDIHPCSRAQPDCVRKLFAMDLGMGLARSIFGVDRTVSDGLTDGRSMVEDAVSFAGRLDENAVASVIGIGRSDLLVSRASLIST